MMGRRLSCRPIWPKAYLICALLTAPTQSRYLMAANAIRSFRYWRPVNSLRGRVAWAPGNQPTKIGWLNLAQPLPSILAQKARRSEAQKSDVSQNERASRKFILRYISEFRAVAQNLAALA